MGPFAFQSKECVGGAVKKSFFPEGVWTSSLGRMGLRDERRVASGRQVALRVLLD